MLLVMHVLNPTLMVLIPLVLAAWVVRRWRLDWAVFGLGTVTFLVSQILHIPFNQFVLSPLIEQLGWLSADGWPWVIVALMLGLSAGLFEESARYLVLKRISSRVQGWSEGVLYGLGHGGIEAIIIGGLGIYGLVQALALRGVPLEGVVPVEQLETARIQLEGYWGMVWYEPLWAVLERVSAIAFHSMAALLVLMSIRQRRMIWLGGAILAHTLFNAVALVSVKALGVAATETILAAIGLGCLWVVYRLCPRWVVDPTDQIPPPEEGLSPQPGPRVELLEAERLDDSRFF